jgi:hypothetical protein
MRHTLEEVQVGSVFRRDWGTRFQVREILSVGQEHINWVGQINDDSCQYAVVAGFHSGDMGQCNRIAFVKHEWKLMEGTSR